MRGSVKRVLCMCQLWTGKIHQSIKLSLFYSAPLRYDGAELSSLAMSVPTIPMVSRFQSPPQQAYLDDAFVWRFEGAEEKSTEDGVGDDHGGEPDV